jgi:hypothetical protein
VRLSEHALNRVGEKPGLIVTCDNNGREPTVTTAVFFPAPIC